PIFAVSSDKLWQILLLDESGRGEEKILRNRAFLSDLRPLTSELVRLLAEIFVIDHIVSGKDSFARHSKFHQILDVTLAADACGRVQTGDSPFDGFLPPGARFILA